MATPTTLPATFVAGNVLTAAQMNDLRGAFRILQVVSTTKTDTFTTSSTTMTDITGLSVTITPSATSSKILVIVALSGAGTATQSAAFFRLMRDATAIAVATSTSNRIATTVSTGDAASLYNSMSAVHLDSPASTSALTYKVQGQVQGGATSTIYVNRGSADTDTIAFSRQVSSITVFEVSA